MGWREVYFADKNDVPNCAQTTYSGFKVTPETDEAQQDWVGTVVISKTQNRLVQASVKRFVNSQNPSIYVYLKLFKWDYSIQNYLKQSQTALTLNEFNEMHKNLHVLDGIIDNAMMMTDSDTPAPLLRSGPPVNVDNHYSPVDLSGFIQSDVAVTTHVENVGPPQEKKPRTH